MKVLITGATGFLGQAVAQCALDEGYKVRAFVRSEHAKLPKGVKSFVGSFDDQESIEKALKSVDAVIHLAGKVSREKEDSHAMHQIHVEASQRLWNAMEAQGVKKVILASTSGTIALSEEPRRRPATEDDQPDFEVIGKFPYYTSKLLQEQEFMRRVEAGKLEGCVINPSLLLGPGDDRLSSSEDVLNILNKKVPAITEGTVALADVRDCAPVFIAALKKGRNGHRYLLNGGNMSVRSFIQRVAVAGDVGIPTIKLPKKWAIGGAKLMEGIYGALDRRAPLDSVSVDMSSHHWDCDSHKASEELGFSARDPQATIEDTVRFLEKKNLFRRTTSSPY